MKKGLKIFLIIAAVGLVTGLSTVYYVFNKPHRDVAGELPSFTLEAKAFYDEYNNNEEASNQKFGDKVIQVSGEIVELTKNDYQVSIVLNDAMEGVSCALDSLTIDENKLLISELKVNDKITLKGKCDGFDMIMGIVLTRCFIVKEK